MMTTKYRHIDPRNAKNVEKYRVLLADNIDYATISALRDPMLRYLEKMKLRIKKNLPHPQKYSPKKICARLGFATYSH
jgi:hypothetical protein